LTGAGEPASRFSGVRDSRDVQHHAPENRHAIFPAPVKRQPFYRRFYRRWSNGNRFTGVKREFMHRADSCAIV